jgi:hypothetical protein
MDNAKGRHSRAGGLAASNIVLYLYLWWIRQLSNDEGSMRAQLWAWVVQYNTEAMSQNFCDLDRTNHGANGIGDNLPTRPLGEWANGRIAVGGGLGGWPIHPSTACIW